MNIITNTFKQQNEYKAFLQALKAMEYEKPRPLLVSGLCEGAKYAFYACCISDTHSPVLAIVPNEKDAMRLSTALTEYGLSAEVFQNRDFSFHNITSSHEYEQQRIDILSAVLNRKLDCVIATPDAAAQYTMPSYVLRKFCRTFEVGGELDLYAFSDFLVGCGYSRVSVVDGVGQFSIRGGIIDVFTPGCPNPYRTELFGNEIDSIGIFDIISQRKIENLPSFSVWPVREVLPDAESIEIVKAAIRSQIKKVKRGDVEKMLRGELDAVSSCAIPDFIDKYINIVYPQPETLLDYFKSGNTVICDGASGIAERMRGTDTAEKMEISLMIENGEINGKYASYSLTADDFDYFINTHPSVTIDTFASTGVKYGGLFTFRTKAPLAYNDSFELLLEDIQSFIKNRYGIVLLCENETVGKNFSSMLYDNNVMAPVVTSGKESLTELSPGSVHIIPGCAVTGFSSEVIRFAVISVYKNQNMYNRAVVKKRSLRAKKGSAKERIMSYADLDVGDYVVHDTYGIGIFMGLKTLVGYDNCARDFLQIKYADEGVLYVPCDRLEVLSKYIGAKASDGTVRINKMGTTDWTKAKARVKAATKEMAHELIELYAKRLRRQGISFPPDDDLQRQFEASFEYEETDGQLTAAEDIKQDMIKASPMDRLLCGDVGFGKTEVALRAAFKAVSDGYQVALLVPTTILAMQHYQTVLSRMRGFPISVEMLCRFRSPKQQAETVRRLKRGDVDIIIGTHRLISKDVEFDNLGLVIIDEEQRFGVAHKEKLKMLCEKADVLTLTATPIPRTLNMAISGIRDMSILDEAPGDRLPPQTYVLEYDEIIIGEAIKKELRRGGQVFYLFNNVDNIEIAVARVKTMCPEANVVFAHGKMDKEELSDVWREVVEGEADVLVCTTIIETGVDVPNANTLIIENADKLGLAQLHQIRGRIGRSSRRSYAYLTYRPNKQLSEIAEKRLEAIREYTEFGAGFKIALRDLEIRGAGNVLGAEQHGHMDSVGYDMYIKLLNEAVLEEKGEQTAPVRECTISLQLSAYLPETYIQSSHLRIEMYKKISHIRSFEDLDDVVDELQDRFGEFPVYTDNLLYIALLRSFGEKLGVSRIEQKENRIMIYPYEFDAETWVKVCSGTVGKLIITPGSVPFITYRMKAKENALHKLCTLLAEGIKSL